MTMVQGGDRGHIPSDKFSLTRRGNFSVTRLLPPMSLERPR